MDELDLFRSARPEVEPLAADVLARIRALALEAADAPDPADVRESPVASDRADPVVTALDRDRTRQPRGRRWMLAAAAVGLVAAGAIVAQRSGSPAHTSTASDPSAPADPASTDPVAAGGTTAAAVGDPAGTAATTTDGSAASTGSDPINILVVGVDDDACVDPDSPYAAAFGDRSAMGERSDTIMVLRLDPAADRAAILSFPRDLWVDIAGGAGKQRINAAYVRDDPQRLIDTIWQDFGIGVDHYVQVDFCAFTAIVDAVGGVPVPFEHPTRDRHTGLSVAEPGCVTLDGDAALAYVRSRHYEWFADGEWQTDPASDLGRITRQQDFLRRVLAGMGERGLFDVDVLRGVIDAVQEDVVVDSGLTISMLLALADEVAGLDPSAIDGYQIEAVGRTIAGQSVLDPVLDSANMRAILAVFRGDAANDTGPAPTDPSVAPAPNAVGVVPPPAVSC